MVIIGPAFNFGYAGFSFGRGSGFFNVRPDALATGINPALYFATQNLVRMVITKSGQIGIGTFLPRQALDVIGNLKLKIDEISSGLPEGVSLRAVYDRSDLIQRAIEMGLQWGRAHAA